MLAQKYFRKAGVPAALKRVREKGVPAFLWRSVADEAKLAALPEGERDRRRDLRPAGLRPARRRLDLLGLEGRATSPPRPTPAPTTTRCATCWRPRWARPTSPQWFNTGLHWAYGIDGPGQGHFYVDFAVGRAGQVDLRLRAPAAARLLHPVGRGRPRQRRRDHGPLDPRGAALQVRLRHRHQLLLAARREREPRGRRQVLGPDVLPQDRRPRRRRHQVGRHHPARRQDGDLRHGSPRHRGLHQLEGASRSRRSPRSSPAPRSTASSSRPSSPPSAPGTAPRPTPSTRRPTPASRRRSAPRRRSTSPRPT